MLVPHEVQGLLDLGDGAGTFPAEVCGCPPVEVVCALLHQQSIETYYRLLVGKPVGGSEGETVGGWSGSEEFLPAWRWSGWRIRV